MKIYMVSLLHRATINNNIFSTCPYNMVNCGPLPAEIGWHVWGTPTDFNGFCVLASLLQRCQSMEANQTLHDIWPSPGLVHYIYIFGGPCPLAEFCHVQNSLCVQLSRSPILASSLHGTPAWASGKLCGVEKRVSPIFVKVAITLGVGPHSSLLYFYSCIDMVEW